MKITISSIVIGLKNSYFPLIPFPIDIRQSVIGQFDSEVNGVTQCIYGPHGHVYLLLTTVSSSLQVNTKLHVYDFVFHQFVPLPRRWTFLVWLSIVQS